MTTIKCLNAILSACLLTIFGLTYSVGVQAAEKAGKVKAAGESTLKLAAGRDILSYQAAFIPSPDPGKPWYGRSGFIHPVLSPSGLVITDDFPGQSHMHQHALMFAWTYTRINDIKVDFWNSHKKLGRIDHVKTLAAGPGHFKTQLVHVNLTGKKPVEEIDEIWEVRAVEHDRFNIFDLSSTHTARREIEIPKYHYGGMCVRGSKYWHNDVTMTGMTEKGMIDRIKGNHSRPKWVVMSGKVDGKMCGIVAMGHPSNFRHPQPVRLHPKMPYFCFAPMALGAYELSPDKPYVSRYRFITFDGELDEAAIEKQWQVWQQTK